MADTPLPAVSQFYSEGDPHLGPERAIANVCQAQGITVGEVGVRPIVIGTYFSELTGFIAQSCDAKPAAFRAAVARSQDVFHVDDSICITTLPIGAPATVAACEEMIACGAKTFLVIGAAGSLQPDLPIGSVVVPTRAIREEGTSHHYVPADVPATGSPELLEALRDAAARAGLEPRTGLHWTSDALYREHKERIDAYRQAGVLSIDMEISALYILRQHRGVGCAAIVAISDELYEPWRIGFATPEFLGAVTKCGLAALEVARAIKR